MKRNIIQRISLLICCLLAVSAGSAVAQDNGIHTNKTSTYDYNTHRGEITLENFVEGEVKTVPAPIDVVMVLDVSDSMKGDKWAALKNSAKRVVSMLNDLVKSGGDARLGIVSFARDAEIEAYLTKVDDAGATALNTAVDGLEMGKTTGMNKGLEKAYELLNTTESLAREQYILFFTDGKPGDNTGDISVANSTSKQAYELKKMGAQFFSILIWTDKTEPSKSYISNLGDNSSNLGTNLSIERFLQLISSHYPWYYNLSTSGGTSPSVTFYYYQDFATKKNTTTFANIPQSDTDISYYRVTRDASGLESLFADVASTIVAGATTSLTETTVVKDFVNNTYFKLPMGATSSDVKVYKVPLTGYTESPKTFTFATLSESHRVTSGITVNVTPGTSGADDVVSVSGFNYSDDANWCGKHTGDEIRGNKLVIKFPFVFKDGMEETTGVLETNSPGSGIYVPDEDGNLTLTGDYEIPDVLLCSITIRRKNLGENESATYVITSTTDPTFSRTICLTGKKDVETVEETVIALPAGGYTITETVWDWTYDDDGKTRNVSLSDDSPTATVLFEGEHKESIEDETQDECSKQNIMTLPGRVAE